MTTTQDVAQLELGSHNRSVVPEYAVVDEESGEHALAGTTPSPPSSSENGQDAKEVFAAAPKVQTTTLRKRARSFSNSVNVPNFLRPSKSKLGGKITRFTSKHLNFYRIHVTFFVLTPLIASAIFYAANQDVHIKYIDALFLCVSAVTVTGLTTINISTATGFQQAILFVLMCVGNVVAVSVTMVWTRRRFFRRRFEDLVAKNAAARKKVRDVEEADRREGGRMHRLRRMMKGGAIDSDGSRQSTDESGHAPEPRKHSTKRKGPLTSDMIRRTDQPAVLVNPMGMPSTAHPRSGSEERVASRPSVATEAPRGILAPMDETPIAGPSAGPTGSVRIAEPNRFLRGLPVHDSPVEQTETAFPSSAPARRTTFSGGSDPPLGGANQSDLPAQAPHTADPFRARFDSTADQRSRRLSDPPAQHHMRRGSDGALAAGGLRPPAFNFPRSQTVEFAEPPPRMTPAERSSTGVAGRDGLRHRNTNLDFERTPTAYSARSYTRRSATGVTLTRTPTTSKERGFGGFPTPVELAGMALKRMAPKLNRQFTRSMTMPRTSTFASTHSGGADTTNGRSAPYLSFDATVSRNSRFLELSEHQREELGGIEYRAIDMLCTLVPAYWLFVVFLFIVMVAPWLASRSAAAKFYQVRETQAPHEPDSTWFWFFNVVSAFSNTGMSLIDTSMINMADQYFMLIPLGTLIIAGNTGFPILFRFMIWFLSRIVPSTGRTYETLRFLLDHPRRCFVYLFPSAQTWFLLFVLVVLNCTDWVAFLVLDLGNPIIKAIPVGQRVFDGLFQSIAVRAAGFQVVSLLSLAPSVQYLYVVMMYISAYPIAMSVRNTNVYEERALGVYEDDQTSEFGDEEPTTGGARVWGTYLAAHARRQLAFDMWWLGFSLWLVCIIERTQIEDSNTNGWFTIFSCLFELTSAYGTVGLSTGTPVDNFSLSGRFRTLSKLVVCAVMLRGRHRGLPVAIDRAVLLPGEIEEEDNNPLYSGSQDDPMQMRSGTGSLRMHPSIPVTSTYTQSSAVGRMNKGMDEKQGVLSGNDGAHEDLGSAGSQYATYQDQGYGLAPTLAPINETPTPTAPALSREASNQAHQRQTAIEASTSATGSDGSSSAALARQKSPEYQSLSQDEQNSQDEQVSRQLATAPDPQEAETPAGAVKASYERAEVIENMSSGSSASTPSASQLENKPKDE
ncbi:related to potassium transporter trk-1 [Ceraceosorus bombacis]|uniref:Related to potassium transporter trk-1 n=1 Tax=Ceraceosorus bombacis TaxID=401625 RepID=A0A0P1BG95_9BASI|nr:related to potassium transporter trk-1 [Ceraceosorus bombacis]